MHFDHICEHTHTQKLIWAACVWMLNTLSNAQTHTLTHMHRCTHIYCVLVWFVVVVTRLAMRLSNGNRWSHTFISTICASRLEKGKSYIHTQRFNVDCNWLEMKWMWKIRGEIGKSEENSIEQKKKKTAPHSIMNRKKYDIAQILAYACTHTDFKCKRGREREREWEHTQHTTCLDYGENKIEAKYLLAECCWTLENDKYADQTVSVCCRLSFFFFFYEAECRLCCWKKYGCHYGLRWKSIVYP